MSWVINKWCGLASDEGSFRDWWLGLCLVRTECWAEKQLLTASTTASASHGPHKPPSWGVKALAMYFFFLLLGNKEAKGQGEQEGIRNRNSLVTSGLNYDMHKVWKSLLLLLWQTSVQIKNQWLFLAITGNLGCREIAILKSEEMGAFRDTQSWSFLSTKIKSFWSHKLVIVVVFSCYVMSDSFATPWIVTCQALLAMGFSR